MVRRHTKPMTQTWLSDHSWTSLRTQKTLGCQKDKADILNTWLIKLLYGLSASVNIFNICLRASNIRHDELVSIGLFVRRQLNRSITSAAVVKQTNKILTVLRMLRMTETSLGWHQVYIIVPGAWTSDGERPVTKMKFACAVHGASHCQMGVGRRLDDRTLPCTQDRDH